MQFFEISVQVMRVLGVWYDANTKYAKAISFLACHTILAATLVILELTFMFVSNDYNERIKTVGIVTFHVICIAKVANAIRVEKRMQVVLKLIESMRFKKDGANRCCFLMLVVFVFVSQMSLIVSYFNALIVRVMPYNHHHLLDMNNTLYFTIETLLQGYCIMFVTFTFVCNYQTK